MNKLLKNLKQYKLAVFLLLIMMIFQAYCDISLPQYTQEIIDTGIQNKGIEHILPEKIAEDEYEEAQIFMSEKERELWRESYKEKGKTYERKELSEEKMNSLDSKLLKPIVLTYQLGHMPESECRKTVSNILSENPRTAMLADQVPEWSMEEINQFFGMDLKNFVAEDEKGKKTSYVDMRPLLQQMMKSGKMDDSMLKEAEEQVDDMIDSIGDSTLKSMGIAYAAECNKAAGVDVDKVQKSYLWLCGGKMVIMALFMMLSAIVVSFIASRVGANIGRDLRGKLFSRVMSFSNAELDQYQTSSLITRATNDVQQVQMVITMLLRMVLYAPVLAVWGIIKVAETKAHMSWVIFLGAGVIIATVLLLISITMPKFRIMQKLVDALNRVSREILTGLPVIRAFGREKVEEDRFDQANVDLKKTQLFTNRVMTFMQPTMMMIMNALVVLIMWVASHRIDNGSLQVGAMTAFITYSMMVVMSFMIITMMSIMLPRAGVAAERLDEVLQTESSIQEKEEALEIKNGEGILTFSHVDFRYPDADENVLTDIDFTAKPGETTAIIGSTGSGKSTLVNLIPRFFDVSKGTVKIDGYDIRDLTLHSLREQIGFVPQKGILFSGTVASNIRFGKENATDQEVREAASIAQASDFIEEKEDGYESFIAQGGSNVSGGQKQRISIARAIAKEPKILVFDDSFSALDMKTDANLRKVLAEKEKDATKIIVAQRVGTIMDAEQILVLDEGRMIGKGTHKELMKNCEVYRQIAESQLSKSELEVNA